MAIFTLTIASRTARFGETDSQERAAVAYVLQQAAQAIASGSAPLAGQNLPEPGNANPTNCSYAFGPRSLNGAL
jgi:hypothetical protein